jgi:hypothetical protein
VDRCHYGEVQCTGTVTLYFMFLDLLSFVFFFLSALYLIKYKGYYLELNPGHNFQTLIGTAFIFHICVSCNRMWTTVGTIDNIRYIKNKKGVFSFLALLAKGQTSYWDGPLSVVRPSVRPSVRLLAILLFTL